MKEIFLNLLWGCILLLFTPVNPAPVQQEELYQKYIQYFQNCSSYKEVPQNCTQPHHNPLCYIIFDYAHQGCERHLIPFVRKTINIQCPINLRPLQLEVKEKAVEKALNLSNKEQCDKSCHHHSDLCLEITNLLTWLNTTQTLKDKSTENKEAQQGEQPPVPSGTDVKSPEKPSGSEVEPTLKKNPTTLAVPPEPATVPKVDLPQINPPSNENKPNSQGNKISTKVEDKPKVDEKKIVTQETVETKKAEPNANVDLNEEGLVEGDLMAPQEGDDDDPDTDPYTQDKPAQREEENDAAKPETKENDTPAKTSKKMQLEEIDLFEKPSVSSNGPYQEAPDSHFFIYFLTFMTMTAMGYIGFHNRNKILGLLVEGRRGRQTGRRRPSSSGYKKLDTSLEEAMMSHPSRGPAQHVIY